MRPHKKAKRKILTINGPLEYQRKTLYPSTKKDGIKLKNLENKKVIYPIDLALGIDGMPFKMTPTLMLEVAYYGIMHDSYEEAQSFLEKRFGFSINDDSIREVVNTVGMCVFENDCKVAEESIKNLYNNDIKIEKNIDGVLYLEIDGCMVNTREKNADGTTWRENKLGIAFTSNNLIRWTNSKGESFKKLGKREYIAYLGGAEEFRKHLLALALRNGYGKFKKTVFIVDGAQWIRKTRDELFPDSLLILDFYHLCENTGNFANFIYKNDVDKAKEKANTWCNLLENGLWEQVLREIEPYKNIKLRDGVVDLYSYIYNNRDSIDYKKYKEQDLFIGSGAIESANKKVIQSRLKLSGMRWSIKSAQNVISLRAKECSSLWNEVVKLFEQWLVNNSKSIKDHSI